MKTTADNPNINMSFSKSLGQVLASQENRLQSNIERAYLLRALSQQLKEALGLPLGPHLSLGNLRDDMAIILTDSPAWLNKARYEAANILYVLRQQPGLAHLQKLQFKVEPMATDTHDSAAPKRRLELSQTNAHILDSMADSISDPDLANALHRLAQRGQQK